MSIKTIIATIKGETHPLTLDSDGYYSIDLPAGSASSFLEDGGFFPVSIVATDDTDLSTPIDTDHPQFGDNLKLFITEGNAPVVNILSPGNGSYIISNVTPEISFEIRDNSTQLTGFSGINPDSIVLKLNNDIIPKDKITINLSDDKSLCSCSYIPDEGLANGNYTITVTAADNDGNSAAPVTRTFEIDNQAPGLEITSPSNGDATSISKITVTGKIEEKNTPVTVTITLNNNPPEEVVVNTADGTFSKDIYLTERGENEIRVTATDSIGNKSTEQTITIRYNDIAPRFDVVEILYEGNQVSAVNKVPSTGTYKIRCKVTTS